MINVNENYIREAHFVLGWHPSLGGTRSEVCTFDCRVLLTSYCSSYIRVTGQGNTNICPR